jgi:hypothetical protein
MNNTTGLIVLSGVLGTLVLLAVYRYFTQRRQLASGRSVGRFFPERRDGVTRV